MNIAICEDNKDDLSTLLKYIDDYCETYNCICDITTYSSAEELLEDDDLSKYHAIFFDIYMKKMLGIDAAAKLRENGYTGSFVFSTSSTDHVFDSFLVDVTDYLVKPYNYDRLCIAMNKLYKINKNNLLNIKVIVDKIETTIYLRDIYCIETGSNHSTLIHTQNNTLKSTTLISLIEQQLSPYSNFLRCHRSFIINMNYVKQINDNTIILQNDKTALLTIRNAASIKKTIARYIH